MEKSLRYIFLLLSINGISNGMQCEEEAELIAEWHNSSAVTALAFSVDGNLLATGDQDGFVKAWKIPEGTLLGESAFNFSIKSLSYNDLAKQFIPSLRMPDEIEIFEKKDVPYQSIGLHTMDGRVTAVADKETIRLYNGPLIQLLKAAEGIDLSHGQYQLLQKFTKNKGKPLNLTDEEKAIFDTCYFLHPFCYTTGLTTQKQRSDSYKNKKSERSLLENVVTSLYTKMCYPASFLKSHIPAP